MYYLLYFQNKSKDLDLCPLRFVPCQAYDEYML